MFTTRTSRPRYSLISWCSPSMVSAEKSWKLCSSMVSWLGSEVTCASIVEPGPGRGPGPGTGSGEERIDLGAGGGALGAAPGHRARRGRVRPGGGRLAVRAAGPPGPQHRGVRVPGAVGVHGRHRERRDLGAATVVEHEAAPVAVAHDDHRARAQVPTDRLGGVLERVEIGERPRLVG